MIRFSNLNQSMEITRDTSAMLLTETCFECEIFGFDGFFGYEFDWLRRHKPVVCVPM